MTTEYMPLAEIVSNWTKAYSLQSEIRTEGILTRVSLWHESVIRGRMQLDIYFKDNKLWNTSIHANLEQIETARHIPHMVDAANRIIARHEYHEARKAELHAD
jgi:hypothetical protein